MGRPKTIENEALLEVARRLFVEQGHATTTRDVARAAGISQAILYQRFRSKEELFLAAMLPPAPDLDALLGPGTALTDGHAHLCHLLERLLDYFAAITPRVLQIVTHPGFDHRSIHQAHRHLLGASLLQGLADRLDALRTQGLIDADDTKATAEVLVAAVHSVAMAALWAEEPPTSSHRDQAERVLSVFWRGLAPCSSRERQEASLTPAPPATPAGRGRVDG